MLASGLHSSKSASNIVAGRFHAATFAPERLTGEERNAVRKDTAKSRGGGAERHLAVQKPPKGAAPPKRPAAAEPPSSDTAEEEKHEEKKQKISVAL